MSANADTGDSRAARTADRNTVPNRAGICGWLRRGRRGIEGYVYLLHRVSGLVLLIFLVAHILLASSRLLGTGLWARLMALTATPGLRLFQVLVYVAFAFHACNGIRLLLIELGFVVGRGERLEYPYRGSIHKQRPLLLAMMVLTGVLIALGGFDMLRIAH